MKQTLISTIKRWAYGPLSPLFRLAWDLASALSLYILKLKWFLTKAPLPTKEQQAWMCEHVTFIYKSFERQSMAKRLYQNIQAYYPGIRVIIADDSKQPLDLTGPGLTVLHLPFNSGLSRGLNAALAQVETPFTIRVDDDELLSPFTRFHEHLTFLQEHPEIDLISVLPRNILFGRNWEEQAKAYYHEPMTHAYKPLKIPHLTYIDEQHVVLGKVPNLFIVRTDAYRTIGYDDNIRMIDHQNFFFRAAGNLVSVLAKDCFILHDHNRFHRSYQQYREDVQGDREYIYHTYIKNRH